MQKTRQSASDVLFCPIHTLIVLRSESNDESIASRLLVLNSKS